MAYDNGLGLASRRPVGGGGSGDPATTGPRGPSLLLGGPGLPRSARWGVASRGKALERGPGDGVEGGPIF